MRRVRNKESNGAMKVREFENKREKASKQGGDRT